MITDCNMPVMDGFEASKSIIAFLSSKGIPHDSQPVIVALTGHVELEYKNKALASGIQQVLSKPICKQILGNLLQSLNYQIEWDSAKMTRNE